MSEITEIEIKSMTKEQNYLRGYKDGKIDVLSKIRAEIGRMDYLSIEDGSDGYDNYVDRYDVLQIIDKYKEE